MAVWENIVSASACKALLLPSLLCRHAVRVPLTGCWSQYPVLFYREVTISGKCRGVIRSQLLLKTVNP